ncbi:TatD family hydrolase [Gudongella oleilytica]|jgi:TatD DNase family protein|uniref:TatD family hydrolase n=1 Tax=Gudongella oleilytica TaxID=1582259 RepID=UPI002A36F334|nr:TatD family hydrolase [Gudongella oleilytica]MDY0255911.1 TatD family hydrolase [Gudongella oleilytica]HMM69152.1 TatD family hydrolase [Gudongella oleilytica]
MFIDSHAHLDDPRFDQDRENVIESLREDGVDVVINIGADKESSLSTLELARKYDNIYAVAGVHPHSASELEEDGLDWLREIAKEEKVVAIGEIGLDFYYDNSPRDIQRKWFKAQLQLAKELGLPVVIHTRDAAKETYDILKEAAADGKLKVLMHCYSGSAEMAMDYARLGFYIALGGAVTFKNARVPREVASVIPLENLMIETDCPYMTPEPFRGKRNEPKLVNLVAEKIAEIKAMPVEELAKATADNARRFFRLP